MIDPNDKSTLDLVGGLTERPALHLVPTPPVQAPPLVDPDQDQSGPLDAAARQRKARAKRKELSQTQGLKAVWLTDSERALLRLALDLHEGLERSHGLGMVVLQKLEPGAQWFAEGQARHYMPKDLHEMQMSGVDQLRTDLDAARRENVMMISERAKAFNAVAVLQDRLRAAGLSTDYREPSLNI